MKRCGFTTVELLVVAGILIILLALGAGSSVNSKVKVEEKSVPTILETARAKLTAVVQGGKLVRGASVSVDNSTKELWMYIWDVAYTGNSGNRILVGRLPPTCTAQGGTFLYDARYDYAQGTVVTSRLLSEGGTVRIRCRYHTY